MSRFTLFLGRFRRRLAMVLIWCPLCGKLYYRDEAGNFVEASVKMPDSKPPYKLCNQH